MVHLHSRNIRSLFDFIKNYIVNLKYEKNLYEPKHQSCNINLRKIRRNCCQNYQKDVSMHANEESSLIVINFGWIII